MTRCFQYVYINHDVNGLHSPLLVCCRYATSTNLCGADDDPTREKCSCTSCTAGKALYILYHQTKTGICGDFPTSAKTKCVALHADNQNTDQTSQSGVCTKRVQTKHELTVNQLTGTDYTHFEALHGNSTDTDRCNGACSHKAVAFCDVHKQTICNSTLCMVQKHVSCNKVCEMGNWDNSIVSGTCLTSYCDGAYGQIACMAAAKMD